MKTIRIATKKDLPIIQHIATIAYHYTYIPILGQAQVDFMLQKIYNLKALSEQLDQGHQFIIAQVEEVNAGFASYSQKEEGQLIFKLQKLYLLPEMQGVGLGRYLVEEATAQVKQQGGETLQLNVNHYNKARGFYEKLGFKIKETVGIPIGEHYYMNDYVMELGLSES